MGFNNSLTGENGSLIYQQIKSPNFSLSGQTGWAILKNGNAYFFNVTATGEITATEFVGVNFIIDSAGIFFYSGTPAAGNLLIAMANVAGSDAFGNSYAQGLNFLMGGKQLVVGETGGNPLIYAGTGNANIMNSGALQAIGVGAGNAEYDEWQLLGPQDKTQLDSVVLQMLSSSQDGTTRAIAQLFYEDSTGTPHSYLKVNSAGAIIPAGSITAVQPGTGTPATPAVGETWHTAALVNSFTSSVSDQVPRYRLEGVGGGIVRLDGTVYTTVGTAEPAGTTMFTLPVGYRPASIRRRFVGLTNAVGYAAGGTVIMVNPNGTVTNGTAATAVVSQFCMDGITFPLD
jgi:hypothetical protein